ncbi:MAG: hypothetical protein M3Z29_05280 [Pseudomonadota bacterium]|nr:hypothetical protein [Pseudomonadota bacterium]
MPSGESFIRGEATFGVVCVRPFDVVCECVEACVTQAGMSVVHRHELGRLLPDACEPLPWQCTTFEVLEREFAGRLIRLDSSLAHVLPWRICVQAGPEMTTVSTAMPSIVITEFAHDAAVGRLARRFESALQIVLRSVAARVSGRA